MEGQALRGRAGQGRAGKDGWMQASPPAAQHRSTAAARCSSATSPVEGRLGPGPGEWRGRGAGDLEGLLGTWKGSVATTATGRQGGREAGSSKQQDSLRRRID
ncbi:hypothetical protein RJ55_02824 [Drechmeria coniospora]|nr:hypothetical protein RJ55_02824 [Drechmeria coniospora]